MFVIVVLLFIVVVGCVLFNTYGCLTAVNVWWV